jgi:uncharacterized membrane protein YeiH
MDINTFLNYIGTWTFGSLVLIDLIAATTNAFNGAILASRADHRRNWTTVGIILIAVIGGIGGGVTRDVLLETCLRMASAVCLILWPPSHCRGMRSLAPKKHWL